MKAEWMGREDNRVLQYEPQNDSYAAYIKVEFTAISLNKMLRRGHTFLEFFGGTPQALANRLTDYMERNYIPLEPEFENEYC